ncbi:MAG TPA: hypothetical protein VGD95_03725 [Micavibrio sp.]
MHDHFKTSASPLARQNALSAQIPQGLGVNRSFSGWADQWERVFRVSPHVFYQTLCRNVPGGVEAYVDLDLGHGGEFNLSIKDQGRTLFAAENKLSQGVGGVTLKFDCWENKNSDKRGAGLGKILLRNILEAVAPGDIHEIVLRAGKEDGRYFWARHGFYGREPSDLQRVAPEIAANIEKYAAFMLNDQQRAARDILQQGGADVCYRLARLEGRIPVEDKLKPLGWALLRTQSEPNYRLDLRDAQQMQRVKAALQAGLSTAPTLVP